MPSWKKVIISGSNAALNSLTVSNGITGSLFGTSSFATTAATSSFLNSTTNAFLQNGNSFGTTALLGTNDNQSLALETNDTTRMFISSSGDVGIGTTSPGSKFTVYENNSTTGTSTGITIEQAGAGDCLVQYLLTGTRRWVTGVDNSDGDKFKIASTVDLNTNARLTIDTDGRIGIGTTTPSYPLHVSASVSGTSIYATGDIVAFSDQSVKENIRPIENVLERIGDSRGILYDRIDNGEKDNIGFIAQELEVAFPELVVTNPDGTKAVKYQNAVAVLFEAVKEQQKQINEILTLLNK